MAEKVKIILEVDGKNVKILDNAANKLGKIDKKSKGAAKTLGNLRVSTLAMVGAAVQLARVVGGSIKVYADFQQAIANVASVSGGAKEQIEALARAAGKETVFSAKEAADALYFLASAGLAVDEMAQVLNPTLSLAAAGAIDIARASDIVVSSLKTFGLEMSQSGSIADIMAKTVASANTDMEQLAEGMKFAGSSARVAGISFEDTSAIMGTLANMGIKGSLAGAQLRQAIARMVKPTSEARKALSKYGITTDEITNLLPTPIKLFQRLHEAGLSQADGLRILGIRQVGLFSVIKNGMPDLINMRAKLEEAGGTAKKMADTQIDTLHGATKLLISSWQELIIFIVGKFEPTMRNIVNSVRGIVIWFRETLPNAIEVAKSIFNSSKGEFKVVIDAIVGIFDNLKESFFNVAAAIGFTGSKTVVAKQVIEIAMKVIATAFSIAGAVIEHIINGIVMSIKQVITVVKGTAGIISSVMNGDWKNAWESAKDIPQGLFENYAEFVGKTVDIGKEQAEKMKEIWGTTKEDLFLIQEEANLKALEQDALFKEQTLEQEKMFQEQLTGIVDKGDSDRVSKGKKWSDLDQNQKKQAGNNILTGMGSSFGKMASLIGTESKKQFAITKAARIAEAGVNTAAAVVSAMASAKTNTGKILWAAVIGALGVAQIAKIAAQKYTPAAEMGAIIPASTDGTLVRAGEKNKPEAIIPLEGEGAERLNDSVGGNTINVNVQNMFPDDEESANKMAGIIDRKLYDLKRNERSEAFSE